VEVTTDGGKTWKDAEFKTPAYRMAHTRFALAWNWDGKACELMSRCTDELGTVQPTRAQAAAYFNEPLTPDYRVKGADNTVQLWKVASDGSVHNGTV
jgi:sulfane dehydrogenase subunit SoxC